MTKSHLKSLYAASLRQVRAAASHMEPFCQHGQIDLFESPGVGTTRVTEWLNIARAVRLEIERLGGVA